MRNPSLKMLLVVVALTTQTYGLPYGELPPQFQQQNQHVWYGNDGVSQVQSNSFPSFKENIVPQQAQYNWNQLRQNTFNGYEINGPSESQKQLNINKYESDQNLQPYPSPVNDLTISCSGSNKVCVVKHLCIDGYVHPLKQGFVRPGQVQECNLNHEVCCTVQYNLNNSPYNQFDEYPQPSLKNDEMYVPYGRIDPKDVDLLQSPLGNDPELQSDSNNGLAVGSSNRPREDLKLPEDDYNKIPSGTSPQKQFQKGGGKEASEAASSSLIPSAADNSIFQFSVHSGCAAALLCVEEQYCTMEGMISPEPVGLSSQQLLQRVALSSCRNRETGVIGKCCRDPNYVDPWPTGNLPANYTGGFDEQGFPTFLNIAKVRPSTNKPVKTVSKVSVTPPPQIHHLPTTVAPLIPDNSDITQHVVSHPTQIPIAPSTQTPFTRIPYQPDSSNEKPVSTIPHVPTYSCGVRNYGQRPNGFRDTDAAFGEIPWQAMVLWSLDRKILCSGVLLSPDTVLTAASCVYSFTPGQLSVKLGEWKLGYELQQEEPLPFEIINVRTIQYHPGFLEGYHTNNTAMLILERPVTYDLHINPLCLPDDYQVQETSQCIVTGWGKTILQAHYAGAIMHMVDVDLLPYDICQNRVLGAEAPINIVNMICGKAYDNNNMCQVDVGAPLACYDGKGAYHIAGIYSQETGCLPTNQVATFAPVDVVWVKHIMEQSHNIESKIDTVQTSIDNSYDYRKSNLPAGNQYLPPSNQYLPSI